jgi:hypothetical protein
VEFDSNSTVLTLDIGAGLQSEGAANMKRAREEAASAASLAAHWRNRAKEFRTLAHGPEASQYRRAAEQAEALAASFERARAVRFTSDFCLTDDGKPVYAEIDGEPVVPGVFPRQF